MTVLGIALRSLRQRRLSTALTAVSVGLGLALVTLVFQGLTLATAACVTGTDPAKIARLPANLDGLKDEVVVHRSQRNGYDFAVRQGNGAPRHQEVREVHEALLTGASG